MPRSARILPPFPLIPGFAFLGLLSAACASDLAAQGNVSGTVYAAPGADIRGTIVIACHVRNDACDTKSPQSKAVQYSKTTGGSVQYTIRDLAEADYVIVAFKDRNGNGAEDGEDWSGHHPAADGSMLVIRPPMQGVDVRLRLGGVADAAAKRISSPVAGPAPQSAPSASPRVVPPPRATQAGRALAGIYVGIRQNWSVSQGVPIKFANVHLFALFADGRAIYAAPHKGMGVEPDWSRCSNGTAICGTYEVRGNQVHAKFDNGYHQLFARDGNRLTQVRAYWDGHEQGGNNERRYYMKVDAHDGLRLDGRWGVVNDDGRELVSIALTRDGRFAERGLLEPTNLIIPSDESKAREQLGIKSGSGTYSIAANTLELRYANGPVLHFLFTVTPEVRWSPLPERIQINRIELANLK